MPVGAERGLGDSLKEIIFELSSWINRRERNTANSTRENKPRLKLG